MQAPTPPLLDRVFEHVASRHPERVAIEVPPGTGRPVRTRVTYAALESAASSIAARLLPHAASDALVVILLRKEDPALYAAQLGVWKAGAAFTCLDARFPDEHLRAILVDARPVAVVADAEGRARLDALGMPLPPVVRAEDAPGPPDAGRRARDDRLAYVVYTSGTTGRPKGVMIEHRSIANLVASDVEEFGLGPEDRVAQVSSPAYDSSFEETWLAFAVGATLVPLDDETVRLGPDLLPWLRSERITVFCPPPTLLRALACPSPEAALPDLRFVYVGGEPFPPEHVDRWAAGRRLENGYGPTECTITVTRTRLSPGRPVTIGLPVPGHRAWILDETLNEVAEGEPGELCIGGVGLARGYLRREELTAEKFPLHPTLGRIYRTGDLARRNAEGHLEHLGRLDGQVKLRGYRVELGAVEAHLAACEGVRAAGCRVQGDGSRQVLVAHVVTTPGASPDPDRWRAALRRALPEYMVPARIATVDALPTTIGGKLDRRALPDLPDTNHALPSAGPVEGDPLERTVAAALARALRRPAVGLDDDFFVALGGDSLAAVDAVIALRGSPATATAAVRDLYEARTARALAERIRRAGPAGPRPAAPAPAAPRARGAPVRATLVQAAWLLLELSAASAVAWAAWFLVVPDLLRGTGLAATLLLAPLLVALARLAWAPIAVTLAVLVKRLLVGRYRAGRAPLWGPLHVRHWIVTRAARWIPWRLVEGTELEGVVLRALGARVGKRVHVHRGVDLREGGWDLLTLGDGATLSQDAAVRVVALEAGEVVFGPVTIEEGATLDVRAGASPGSTVGRNAWVGALSWVPPGARVPEGERWEGVPARRVGRAPEPPAVDRRGEVSPGLHGAAMVLLRCVHVVLATAGPAALGFALAAAYGVGTAEALAWLAAPRWSATLGLALTALAVLSIPLSLVVDALACRLLGRIAPGAHSLFGPTAIKVWVKTAAVEAAHRWLCGALLWPVWLRAAGMRIGRGCEISTVIDVVPETVEIGDESFFADGVYLCGPRVQRGTVTVSRSRIGKRTFLGNHAVVPPGHDWPDDLFVGVSTAADPARARPGTSWFGTPAMELPHREVVTEDRRLTHDPDLLRWSTRAFFETLRLALPLLPVVVLVGWLEAVSRLSERIDTVALLLLGLPAVTLVAAAVPCAAVLALKWALLGRVRPGRHAFWSCWCGRWDIFYVAWEVWARELLTALDGTLLLNAYLRLMGMRIGRRVALGAGHAQVVDPDMIVLEDDATVSCQFQAHTFEDRVLKIDTLRIGRGATVGDDTVVFFGADVGDGARVAPNGVVMKRDLLPADGVYEGCPTAPAMT